MQPRKKLKKDTSVYVLQVEGVNNVEFQLRVSLFDLAYHQFFGRQWAGQYSELVGLGGQSKPKLRLSQVKCEKNFS